ncbi:Gamma-butyrobetaine dioxygenase-like 1 [Homarus americanus]|uniref:Gamma-butyrobetaine dioxygenase-like 1 n=1 Tax=Homarus americanus TaxID=6706 RepID=A0A8J5K5C5_HOMAM|nr:Gamma-butyrobetaine dioxygenase-like 1 [Homarus americanus]
MGYCMRGEGVRAFERCLSTTVPRQAQVPDTQIRQPGNSDVTEKQVDVKTIKAVFGDGTTSTYPHVWLRENCTCKSCFNSDAIARLFLIDDLCLDIRPNDAQVKGGNLHVEWSDGHLSTYTGKWLHERAFTPEARAKRRSRYMLSRHEEHDQVRSRKEGRKEKERKRPTFPIRANRPSLNRPVAHESDSKVRWGSGFQVPRLNFQSAMEEDQVLLDWLVQLEKFGVVLVEDAPTRVGTINDFIDTLGFIKSTHYGQDYEIINQITPNNLAYTGSKLGLHTDMPYYEYPPGTTWLHCIRQHEGKGGANVLSDGLNATELMKEIHPQHYATLVTTPIYFQDKGFQIYDFDKITKTTTIELDEQGKLKRLHTSSQSRDSIMDLTPEQILAFYSALKTFNNTLYEHSIEMKTKPGDILVLDNSRVMHSRTAFDPSTAKGPRHLHNAYIDWDELRSKRRVLQDKLGVSLT